MKLFSLIVMAAMALALPAQAADIGQPAPAFSATDISGNKQSIAQYAGKTVVLEWHNPECPFVKKHYESGNMQQLQKYALDKGVVWLTVNSGAESKQGHMSSDQAKADIAKNSAQQSAYIIDADGAIGRLYGAKTTPHMYVIDAKGKLSYMGAIDDKPSTDKADIALSKNYVKAAIDELLVGKPVSMAQSQAYGCGVKYKD